jgi:hypothetical protein
MIKTNVVILPDTRERVLRIVFTSIGAWSSNFPYQSIRVRFRPSAVFFVVGPRSWHEFGKVVASVQSSQTFYIELKSISTFLRRGNVRNLNREGSNVAGIPKCISRVFF